MSQVWTTLTEIQDLFVTHFDKTGVEVFEPGMERFNQPGWVNRVWTGSFYRRAHVDVVDARDSKGLWMMHCCVFPHVNNPAPIFGFDVIAGQNKITGCFIDYSPTADKNHAMCAWFATEVAALEWCKPRPLPDWAQRIFSASMVAAGNVRDPQELAQIRQLAEKCMYNYTATVMESAGGCVDATDEQNYYAQNQKMNPHTPRVMVSLGLSQDDVEHFIQDCLFPEIR